MPHTEYEELAIEAAQLGGKVLRKYAGNLDCYSIEEKRMGDWVSEADKESETAIVRLLSERTTGHHILTEETGLIESNKSSKYRWIIDPLDGTTNFIRGFPVWAVSVALEYRPDNNARWGEIVAGAIHIPPTGETFHACKGCGAYVNGKKLNVTKGRSLRDSLLATGFPFRTRDLADKYIALFGDILSRCGDVRRAGAVAIDLSYLAGGIFDGFWELDLGPWDVAAGGLIITEAGGRVANFQGGSDYLTTGDIIAGNPTIFDELVRTIKRYFPVPREVDKAP